MENNKDVKRILDSVHGYINIPGEYIKNIIDTDYFQRLRRIEQTSGRSLFPSARHDRFIHSLGVFHIGTLIIKSLERRNQVDKNDPHYKSIAISYGLACLLHDIGHTPFSHTFEDYYKNSHNKLNLCLKDELKEDSDFAYDYDSQYRDVTATHEVLSAIVTVKIFSNFLKSEHEHIGNTAQGDVSLIARMIVGCKYLSPNHGLENAFIELLHSKTMDADGLDYVCRDAWASGYRTSQVDLQRLIDAIMLTRYDYDVCFDVKAINEIRSVIFVKNFQQDNVITHHTVAYEQELLKKAVESAAVFFWKCKESKGGSASQNAMEKLCNIDSYFGGIQTKIGKHFIRLPIDDDFIYLMKSSQNNDFAKEWLTRRYELVPLWKSREQFMTFFIKFKHDLFNESCWLFLDNCKSYLSSEFNVDYSRIWIVKALPKNKMANLKDLKLLVEDNVVPYTSLYPKETLLTTCLLPHFCYIFIPRIDNEGKSINFNDVRAKLRDEFVKKI